MKRVIAIGLLVNAALLAQILLKKEVVVHAAGGGGAVPVGNGDVNGDGTIDISDGVAILNWLFTGGKELVPIECPAPAVKGLPATGQKKCYDEVPAEIDCASADFPGQDGSYQAACPTEGRFVDKDGTVTDSCTGLMWQKDTANVDRDGAISPGDSLNWQAALKYCDALDFAGHTDWRLPNGRELQSIVDYGRFYPAIDPVFGAEPYFYWSSSSVVGNPRNVWFINFVSGDVLSLEIGNVHSYVRAVRNTP